MPHPQRGEFCEVRRAIYHDEKLYDSSNVIKIAHGGFEHSQQLNCHPSCGDLALLQANLLAHLPKKRLTILFTKAAGQMNLVTGPNERRERRHISIHHWGHYVGYSNVKTPQSLVNGRHVVLPSTHSPKKQEVDLYLASN
jgi:hypothetical protein